MLGIFGCIFGDSRDNEWDEKPQRFNGSFTYTLPADATNEQKIRAQQFAQESLKMASMSKREQLEYLKRKTGL